MVLVCGACHLQPKENPMNNIDAQEPADRGFVVDSRVMYAVGFAFVLIAAILTVRELDLKVGWLVSLLLLALAAGSEFLKGFVKAGTLLLFALVGLATPTCFFLLTKTGPHERDLAFYVGSVVFFGLSTYLVLRTRNTWSQFDLRISEKHALNLESAVVWFALIASSLACSWTTYFNFLTTHDELIERRLAFTLFLIVVGVVSSVFGRKSPLPFLGILGLTFMVAGVAKALAYDTTHLHGFLRIGVFAGGGAMLLLGGALLTKKSRPTV
jgi:hypothetical protein